jgi:hypothetical protein
VFRIKFDRVLAAIVGGGLFLLGAAELIVRLDEPAPLFFWLPTLWGGSALVLLGSFRKAGRIGFSVALVTLGGLLGFIPTAWTVLMPVLIVTLWVRTAMAAGTKTSQRT